MTTTTGVAVAATAATPAAHVRPAGGAPVRAAGSAPAPVPLPTALRRAVRYEWRHLAGLRSTWILGGIAALLGVLAGVALALEAPAAGAPAAGAPAASSAVVVLQWDAVSTQLPLLALLLLPLGTGPVATELARGAARTAWLTQGSRSLSYAAKLVTGAGVMAGTALLCGVLTALTASAGLALTGSAALPWADIAGPFGWYLLFMACWPVLCTAVAALVRNRVGTVLALTLWPLLGERIVGLVAGQIPGLGSLPDWLPFAAGRASLAGYGGDDPELLAMLAGSDLAPAAGAAVFVTFTLLLAVAGAYVYRRRDAA
jgi:hypothetical protein